MSTDIKNSCASGLSVEDAHAIETETIELRERMAVFYSATMGALAMRGDDLPTNEVIDEHLPHGLRRVFEDVQAGTVRIVNIAFGKKDPESQP